MTSRSVRGACRLPMTTAGAEHTMVMELKSRLMSKGSFESAALLECDENAMRSVWPSGWLFATRSAPMFPEAPSLFSTNTLWPQRSESFWAMMRPMMSVPPPGAKPTIRRTGFAGYVCAKHVFKTNSEKRRQGSASWLDPNGGTAVCGVDDRLEHRHAVNFVAAG